MVLVLRQTGTAAGSEHHQQLGLATLLQAGARERPHPSGTSPPIRSAPGPEARKKLLSTDKLIIYTSAPVPLT